MSIKTIVISGSLAAALAFWVFATKNHNGLSEHNSHDSMETHTMDTVPDALPEEGGQATFAAIIELVKLLEQDSSTDWENINIDRLRSHLLDMDYLMRETTATTTVVDENSISFDVIGNKESIKSIHNMAPAHAQFIQQSRQWQITTELHDTGATLNVRADAIKDITMLTALGFYGFMSLDSHHQAHHYQMARGMAH